MAGREQFDRHFNGGRVDGRRDQSTDVARGTPSPTDHGGRKQSADNVHRVVAVVVALHLCPKQFHQRTKQRMAPHQFKFTATFRRQMQFNLFNVLVAVVVANRRG